MAGSIASLGSLTPSLSPAPEDDLDIPSAEHPQDAGMDGSSELSELTEDEQEQDHKKSSPAKFNSNQAEDDEDDDEDDEDDEDANGLRQYGGRAAKKKRGGLVPAPMWGWATSRSKKADSRSGPDAEEEEEELTGPPRAMEEEEEDEDGDSAPQSLNGHPIDEEYDGSPYPNASLAGSSKPLSKSHLGSNGDASAVAALTQLRGPRKRAAHAVSLAADDEDIGRAGDETEDEDEEDEVATSVKRPLAPASRWRRASMLQPVEPDGSDLSEGEDEDEDATSGRRKPPANGSDNELDAQDDPETEDEDDNAPLADDPDAEETPSTTGLMAIDSTAPPTSSIAPIAAAAAATSITAGSGVIDPPSPGSSSASTPASSRSPSPMRDDAPLMNGKSKKKGKKVVAEETPSRPLSRGVDAKTRVEEPDATQDDPEDLDADQDLDLELESDLQPAHRAEALDVLAAIELKFALLRERIYVEKMDVLAWEEALINEDIHPELLHLQDELSKRRDKRLALAARRRDYDVKSVITCRKANEKGVWSWWKHSRDELQVDMIAETNRKRRKLERERRAFERPQPLRKTPTFVRDIPEGPSLRQAANTYPLGSRSSRKRGFALVDFSPASFPDLSTLSANDISADLELAYQHRRQAFDATQRMPGSSMNGVAMMQVPYDGYSPNGIPLMESMMSGTGMCFPPDMRMRLPMDMAPPIPSQPSSFAMGANMGQPSHRQTAGMHGIQSPSAFVIDRDPMHSAGGPSLPHLAHQQQQHFGPPPSLANGMTRPLSPIQVIGNGPGMTGPGINGGSSKASTDFGSVGRVPVLNTVEQPPRHTGGMDWSEGRRRDPGPSMNGDEFARPRDRSVVGGEKANVRERDYAMRDSQELDRKVERGQRERESERERERESDRAAQATAVHRPSHQHGHNLGTTPAHHHVAGHHHHRPHHHHVVHHHHPPSCPGVTSGNTSSGPLPPPGYVSGPTPGEFEPGHSRPGSSHNIEIINVSKLSPNSSLPHWKRDELEGRDVRHKQTHSRPPSTNPAYDDRDRPASTPFAIPPSQSFVGGPGVPSPSGLSGPASSSHVLSPRNPWLAGPDEPGARSGPPFSDADRFASPVPHRYSSGGLGSSSRPAQPSALSRPSSIGQSPPRNRNLPGPPSPSSLPYPPSLGGSGLHSPSRFSSAATILNNPDATSTSASSSVTAVGGPPPLGSGSTSPYMKPRRLGSPPLPPSVKQSGPSPPLTGPGQMPPPLVIDRDARDNRDRASSNADLSHPSSGPGPRTASPLLSFVNGPSSRTGPPGSSLHNTVKVNAIQMMDGP